MNRCIEDRISHVEKTLEGKDHLEKEVQDIKTQLVQLEKLVDLLRDIDTNKAKMNHANIESNMKLSETNSHAKITDTTPAAIMKGEKE